MIGIHLRGNYADKMNNVHECLAQKWYSVKVCSCPFPPSAWFEFHNFPSTELSQRQWLVKILIGLQNSMSSKKERLRRVSVTHSLYQLPCATPNKRPKLKLYAYHASAGLKWDLTPSTSQIETLKFPLLQIKSLFFFLFLLTPPSLFYSFQKLHLLNKFILFFSTVWA